MGYKLNIGLLQSVDVDRERNVLSVYHTKPLFFSVPWQTQYKNQEVVKMAWMALKDAAAKGI